MAKLTYPLMAAEVMDHFIDHDAAHGYSQLSRDGVGSETITLSDGTQVSFSSGDRDCSRLIQTCYVVVGVLPRGMHMWTGNEREILLANGFVEVPLSGLQRGDVLWRSGHTEMYLGGGMEGGARRSEYHTIDGRTGDQDGGEIARSSFVRSHWTSAYRCTKVRPEAMTKVPKVSGAMYRLYGGSNDHFLTTNHAEAEGLANSGWSYEGVAWTVPSGGADVYRLYCPNGEHLLTANKVERDALVEKGWRYEGVACKSGGNVPIYRVYDPKAGRHLLTANRGERDALLRSGWRDEGVALHAER